MRLTCLIAFLLLAPAGFPAAEGSLVTTAAELERIVFTEKMTNRAFRLTATAMSVCNPPSRKTLYLEDATGETSLFLGYLGSTPYIRPGDVVEASGVTADDGNVHAQCLSLKTIGRASLRTPPAVTSAEIRSGRHLRRRVRAEGVVRDVFPDEIDPNILFLVIGDATGIFCVTLDTRLVDATTVRHYIGYSVSVSGICSDSRYSPRTGIQYMLSTSSPSDIRPTQKLPDDPFDAPALDAPTPSSPKEVRSRGRRRASGRVIAAWGGDRLMIETPTAGPVRVELAEAMDLPICGDFVEAVGVPETDMFKVNLSHAVCRRLAKPNDPTRGEPAPTTIARLIRDADGRLKINHDYDGRVIRLSGRIISVSASASGRQVYLSDDGAVLRVEMTALPRVLDRLVPDSDVAVTGTFVMQTENWTSEATFPRINDCLVVPWNEADVRILRRPSWWTPARLFALLGAVTLLLVVIVIWNVSLQRLADRRGRALAAESIARAEADFKVSERTRLAIELHDSLAQHLTGTAFEIDTARRFAEKSPEKMMRHLDTASRSLQSSRDELRNCLWDLRNRALEISDAGEALRQILLPVLQDAELQLRFHVPRERLSDNTMHAVICIIRELALNAVRHGHARKIKVAGAIEGNELRFSVTDDGTGFDPAAAPGVREGHYGLLGIHERVSGLNGRFEIARVAGGGMHAVVSLQVPKKVST